MQQQESLIDYPCDFPIKIMGAAREDFVQAMLVVVRAHDPGFNAEHLSVRASGKGSYLALTCTVRAISREQLDSLYRDLSSHPYVKIVL